MLHQHQSLANGWKLTIASTSVPKIKELPQLVDEYNLCAALGYNGKYPWFVVHCPEKCYHTFWIDKDTKKFVKEFSEDLNLREINAPAEELKHLQQRLVSSIFNKLPKHPANFAYMSGKNICDAASSHVGNDVLIHMDIRNFFGMHNEFYVRNKLREVTGYSKEICWFITKLCSYKGNLPQGSVSSPILSIVLNYDMDQRIEAIAKAHNLIYTRYADDLCFSGSDQDNKALWAFIAEIENTIHPFKLNWDKVHIMRNKAYKYIDGIEITGPISTDLKEIQAANPRYKVIQKAHKVIIISRGGLHNESYLELDALFRTHDNQIKPHYYYVQSIQRMLGLNITGSGTEVQVHYPRKKYMEIRLIANLIKKGVITSTPKFRGRLSFMRMVDPHKAAKIDAILGGS